MCPPLDDPENGRVTTPPPYIVNSTALYVCNSGFEPLNGSIRRVCMADGTWTSSAPLCVSEYFHTCIMHTLIYCCIQHFFSSSSSSHSPSSLSLLP